MDKEITIYAQIYGNPNIRLFPTFPMKCHSQRKTNYERAMTQRLRREKHFIKEKINTVVSKTAERRSSNIAKGT